jgi:hypothetical protein
VKEIQQICTLECSSYIWLSDIWVWKGEWLLLPWSCPRVVGKVRDCWRGALNVSYKTKCRLLGPEWRGAPTVLVHSEAQLPLFRSANSRETRCKYPALQFDIGLISCTDLTLQTDMFAAWRQTGFVHDLSEFSASVSSKQNGATVTTQKVCVPVAQKCSPRDLLLCWLFSSYEEFVS